MTYSRDRGYAVDESFFAAPFTEESAYVLGFWAGDGWVHNTRMAVTLAEKDKSHLEMIKRLMHSKHPLMHRERDNKSYYRLSIGSKTLTDRLRELGIIPRKSLIYDPQTTLKHIPHTHHRHFYRGLIDADGHVCTKNARIGLTGSEYTCAAFKDFLLNSGIETTANVHATKSKVHRFNVSGLFLAAKACELLYKDTRVALTRKYGRAIELIEKAEEKS